MPPLTLLNPDDVLDDEGVMTVKETMAYLKISERQVYDQMEQQGLPYFKIGAHRKVPVKALKKWCVDQGIKGSVGGEA